MSSAGSLDSLRHRDRVPGSEQNETSALYENDSELPANNHDNSTLDTAEVHGEYGYFTMDQAISFIGFGKFQWMLLMVTAVCWSSAAIQLMLSSDLVLFLQNQTDWEITEYHEFIICAVPFLGEMFGAYLIAVMSDRYGRQKAVLVSCVILAFFGILSSIATSFSMLVVFRLGVGFAVGGSLTCLSLFSEFIPKEKRGEMTFIEISFWSCGALFATAVAWWFYCVEISWRWYLLAMAAPAVLATIMAVVTPESPRFLLSEGETEACLNTLEIMARYNGKDMEDLPGTLAPHGHVNAGERGRFIDLFRPAYRYTTMLLTITAFCAVGAYFGVALFQLKYFELYESNNFEILWEIVLCTASEFPGIFIGMLIFDHVGRKPFMIATFIMTALAFLGLVFANVEIGIGLIFIARMSVCTAYNILFVYILEYYPTAVRATAIGAAVMEARISGIGASYISTVIATEVSSITYCVFAVIAMVCVFLLPTETLNRDMSDDVDSTAPIETTAQEKDGYQQTGDTDPLLEYIRETQRDTDSGKPNASSNRSYEVDILDTISNKMQELDRRSSL